VDADLDTLAAALYVRTDDLLKTCPEWAPWRPAIRISPRISDAELATLAMMQALLGFVSEARWLRYARGHLRHLFPFRPRGDTAVRRGVGPDEIAALTIRLRDNRTHLIMASRLMLLDSVDDRLLRPWTNSSPHADSARSGTR
jgi:hypothetical protein